MISAFDEKAARKVILQALDAMTTTELLELAAKLRAASAAALLGIVSKADKAS